MCHLLGWAFVVPAWICPSVCVLQACADLWSQWWWPLWCHRWPPSLTAAPHSSPWTSGRNTAHGPQKESCYWSAGMPPTDYKPWRVSGMNVSGASWSCIMLAEGKTFNTWINKEKGSLWAEKVKEIHVCSRIVTVILVVVSVVWIPILQSANSGQLYVYIQSVTSYLAPPVTAVFTLAVFWKRTNEQVTHIEVHQGSI